MAVTFNMVVGRLPLLFLDLAVRAATLMNETSMLRFLLLVLLPRIPLMGLLLLFPLFFLPDLLS